MNKESNIILCFYSFMVTEIDRLKDENASIRKWNVCEKEQYEQLLESDKRRIELMETVLKDARTALELLHHMNLNEFCFVFEVRCAIDALLGGAKDDQSQKT